MKILGKGASPRSNLCNPQEIRCFGEEKHTKNYILAKIPTRCGWDGARTEKRYE